MATVKNLIRLVAVICQTGNTLLGSLVRLPDNHLDVSESERVLRHEEKFTELVDLFRSKQMHRQGMCTVLTYSDM